MNHLNNRFNHLGKERVLTGNTVVLEMPKETAESIEKAMDMSDGLVDANVVMDELHIGKKTLSNMISSGKIRRSMYTVCVNGMKKFFIKKILGLER